MFFFFVLHILCFLNKHFSILNLKKKTQKPDIAIFKTEMFKTKQLIFLILIILKLSLGIKRYNLTLKR